jgi:hypothetical protein
VVDHLSSFGDETFRPVTIPGVRLGSRSSDPRPFERCGASDQIDIRGRGMPTSFGMLFRKTEMKRSIGKRRTPPLAAKLRQDLD